MSEADEMDERTLESELAASLERHARHGTVSDDVRGRAARRVRDAFDDIRTAEPSRSKEPSELLEVLDQPSSERPHRWILLGAAAGVAALIIGLFAVVPQTRDASDEAAPSGPAGSSLLAGRYTTDALGGTVALTAEAPTRLTRLGPGVIELAVGTSADATTITVAHPTALTEQIEIAGFVSVTELLDATPGTQRTPSSVGGTAAPRWRWARPTSDGPCRGGACTELFTFPGDVGITEGRTTDVWVVETTIGTEVIVIASLNPDDFSLSPPWPVTEIVDGLDLGAIGLPLPTGSPTIASVEAGTD